MESSAPFDPGGSDCPWDRGRAVPPDPELLAKPWRDIQRCFDLHHLPFTRAEIEWLQSPGYDPEITIEEEYYWGDMHCVVDGKRLRRIPNRKPCELPLGPVTLQRIDYDALVSLPMPASEALLDALTWVRTDRLRREVMAHPDWKSVRAENRFHVSRHLLDDLPELHKQGLFAVHAWGPTSFDVPLFKVPKAGDLDSRLIGDCRDINVLIPKPGCMGLIALPDLIRRLLGKRVLYQRDARSYFYHFGLSPSASEVLSVRWGGHRGEFYTSRWLVMPMGFSHAPRVANLTSVHMCNNAAAQMPNVELIPWVDNFLYGTDNDTSMNALIVSMDEILRRCNIELKPFKSGEVPGATIDAVGLHFDVTHESLENHFVELAPDFRAHMQASVSKVSTTMEARTIFEVFGACMWANYAVGRYPLCRWSSALTTIREVAIRVHQSAPRDAWNDRMEVTPKAQQELKEMLAILGPARLTLKDLQRRACTRDLWTDASSWAWGYLDATDPNDLAGAHRRHAISDIFLAELVAACDAWFSTKDDVPRLYVDNTGAVGALRKGHSRTAKGNLILSRLYEYLPMDAQAELVTVPTACQRSDAVSRGLWRAGVPCHHRHVIQPVAWKR